MTKWEREESICTRADRQITWDFMTDLSRLVEGPADCIELDGPFVTGTKGRTISPDYEQEWELTEVGEREQFGMTGFTPDGKGSLTFFWRFEDEEAGTKVTYRILALGADTNDQLEELEGMGDRMPKALATLAEQLDEFAQARS